MKNDWDTVHTFILRSDTGLHAVVQMTRSGMLKSLSSGQMPTAKIMNCQGNPQSLTVIVGTWMFHLVKSFQDLLDEGIPK